MHRNIEERLYEHCLQANALEGLMQEKSADGAMLIFPLMFLERKQQKNIMCN